MVMWSWVISLVVHSLVIALIWVGFAVPAGNAQGVSFTYLGQIIPSSSSDTTASLDTQVSFSDHIKPWVNMRQVNKPK